jgi:diguanylate cyclase (GGDEF)-like protein/excisionase family DNA binding protein
VVIDADGWIGIADTARYLSVPVRTMYRLAQRGQVPAVKVGRTWRFKRSVLDARLGRAPGDGHVIHAIGDATEATSVAKDRPIHQMPSSTASLLSDARRWSQQLERIEALSRKLSRSRDVLSVAEAVASEIASVIDWHGLRFFIVERDEQTLQAVVLRSTVPHYASETPEQLRIPIGHGLAGHVAASRVAEIVSDVRADSRGAKIPGTADVDESMIIVPLVYEDAILGILELIRLGTGAFDATDLRLAQIVGAQAAVALSNARQLEELERRGEALERRLASQRQLLAITERLLLTRDRGAVFEAIANTLAEVVPYDTLTIYLVDRAEGCLVPILARDPYAEQILATRPALGDGITGDVIGKGEAECINDAAHDPRVIHVPGTPDEEEESLIVAPVRSPDGVIGALNLYRVRRKFDDEDLELVRLFANHVAIALENAAINERLISAALTDPLTGLPNRRLFADRVEHALARRERSGARVAVLFLDLDRFKLVNDGLGHAAGDAVLQAVGERLRTCLRTSDTVARLGGDEFGILLEDVAGPDEAGLTAQRVLGALSSPLQLDGRAVPVRASIGLALDRVDEDTSTDEVLRDADTAMYRAKANGRGGVAVFEPSMLAHQLARLELDGELREAIERGQFVLRYQPIVDLSTGRVVEVEALVRWDHPTRGVLGPDDFIDLSEESGQIVAIGSWVVREACRQARSWQLEGGAHQKLRVSVNTSPREVVEATFVAGIEAALAESGLSPDCLTLEITESMMLADETVAIAALRRLRSSGVHIVIDDFGTGYSALSYLNQLPVDGLKIDRSFVQGLGIEREKTAIVRATIAFARGLGLVVTAEGIETEAQLRQLMALHCDLGQGYWFAVPLDAREMGGLFAPHAYGMPRRPGSRRTERAPAPRRGLTSKRLPAMSERVD